MSRLKGAASKIDWAKEHLDHLDREMGEFLTDPYTITCKDKFNDHRHYLRFEFKPIPISIPLIAGDFCYCLRSGLDQLAWQLARINKVAQPRTAASFPIFSTKPPNGFKDKTKDLLPVAVEVIEALQPYQRGAAFKEHPLWLLNELCNIDRHMLFAVHSVAGTVSISNVEVPYRRELQFGFEIGVSLSDKLNVQWEIPKTAIIFGKPASVRGEAFEIELSGFHTIYSFIKGRGDPEIPGFFQITAELCRSQLEALGEGTKMAEHLSPLFRPAFPSSAIISERSSPSRVRFAAPNNGAPLTAPGGSGQHF
jgi:hypothetical protein